METLTATKMIEITPEIAGYKNDFYKYYVTDGTGRFKLCKVDNKYCFVHDEYPTIKSNPFTTKKEAIEISLKLDIKIYAWPIEFSKPKSNLAEVLLTLIQDGNVSIKDYGWMCGFRTRCSDLNLKYGLKLDTKPMTDTNKHGREFRYNIHILPESQIEYAIELYNKINK